MNGRIFGAVFVVVGATMLGVYSGFCKRKRIEIIKEFIWSLEQFKALISTLYETIPDICFKIADSCDGTTKIPIRGLYSQVAEKLDEKGNLEYKKIWERAVCDNLSGTFLEKNDIKVIMQMSSLPITLGKDAIINKIVTIENELEKIEVYAEKQIHGQCRVYWCTGLCAGVIMVILLI